MSLFPAPGSPLVLGRRYRLDHRLGEGSFGEVWRGHDLDQDDEVAVKLYEDYVSVQDVLLESRVLTRLLKHPNVVNIRNVAIEPPRPFMVMDYVPGGSVAARIGTNGVPLTDAHRWTRTALQGLIHVHSLGIFHRDMKPANLLIGANGEALISDFGLAEDTVRHAARTGIYWPHIAPEQISGGSSTVQTDVWATGCTLFRLLTGHYPFGFPPDLKAVAAGHWCGEPHHLNPQVPLKLSRVVRKALDPNPAERYADAASMHSALNDAKVWCCWDGMSDPDALEAFMTHGRRGRYELRCVGKTRGRYEVVLKLDMGKGARAVERTVFTSRAKARQHVATTLRRVVQMEEA